MTSCEIVAPLALQHGNEVTCNSPWFVQDTEYRPRPASYKPLINGEEAFRAVHEAIAKATKSVDIICWGFQPSMYFIRDGSAPCIGDLLIAKATDKNNPVRVRILGWEAPYNLTGFVVGESNLPSKEVVGPGQRAGQTSTDEQYAYERRWFRDCSAMAGEATVWDKARPIFISRGFGPMERTEIAYQAALHSLDPELDRNTITSLAGAPSHHQKTVLVDYEIPELAVGFVMGHNMLDEYWDTDLHSAKGRASDMPAPNKGPRGRLPRQDISSRVTGPILAHLHHNFAFAWRRETGEDLFVLRNDTMVARQLQPGREDSLLMAQLLRTQAQEGRRDIEKLYLQAVNNAAQFIYIENQYFRWPALADVILDITGKQTQKGREPGLHGPLHLFVVTNANKDGVGDGIVNTQRMLERLGREDSMPTVTKLRRVEQAKQRAAELEPAWHERLGRKVTELATALPDALQGTNLGERARDAQREADAQARQRSIELQQEIEAIQNNEVRRPAERPGLKIHICSLVAKDSPPGAWMPVYIHSKLMIIDDVFTTHGSANINTRSMQVDSEMNIAHEELGVTQPMRRLFLLACFLLAACDSGGTANAPQKEIAMDPLPQIRANLAFTCKHEEFPTPTADSDMLFQYARWLQKNNQLKEAPGVDVQIERLYRIAAEYGHAKANINLQNGSMQGVFKLRTAEHLRLTEELIDAKIGAGYAFIAIALQQGALGLVQDKDMALRYYRKAADMGSPEAQTYVADKLAPSDMAPDIARQMRRCAAEQGNEAAATDLGVDLQIQKRFKEALEAFQLGVAAGDESSASVLNNGFRNPPLSDELYYLDQKEDLERANRYKTILRFLARYSYASPKVPEINEILPLPPAKLPPWDGKLKWLEERKANIPPPKPSEALIQQLAKDKHLDPATGRPTPESPHFVHLPSYPVPPICVSGEACPRDGYWQAMDVSFSWITVKGQPLQRFRQGDTLPTLVLERRETRLWPLPKKVTVGPQHVRWILLGDA